MSISTLRTPWWQGENAERSASLREYYTTPLTLCQAPFGINFRLFSTSLKKSAIPTISALEIRRIFFFVDIITKFSMKNWHFWIFTNHRPCAIITERGGSTCCVCTVDHRPKRSANLMTPMRVGGSFCRACFFDRHKTVFFFFKL